MDTWSPRERTGQSSQDLVRACMCVSVWENNESKRQEGGKERKKAKGPKRQPRSKAYQCRSGSHWSRRESPRWRPRARTRGRWVRSGRFPQGQPATRRQSGWSWRPCCKETLLYHRSLPPGRLLAHCTPPVKMLGWKLLLGASNCRGLSVSSTRLRKSNPLWSSYSVNPVSKTIS